jgi:hypothetical protein
MIALRIAILSLLFIFGIMTRLESDSVKSINNAANPLMIMKMDENNVLLQTSVESPKEPPEALKKRKARFQSVIPYTDYGAIMGSTKLEVNILKAPPRKKKLLLQDSLDKWISSREVIQKTWRDKFLNFGKIVEAKSSASEFSQSHLRPYPAENGCLEEGGIQTILRRLQFKRGEIFEEMFMGLRLSFDPTRGHMVLEMGVAPSSDKEAGFTVPFWKQVR